jgi:hypothetical protein
MSDAIFPEAGVPGLYTFDGQPVTVEKTGKRGRPRKDGTQGGYVEYFGIDGEERRVTLTEWQRKARAI